MRAKATSAAQSGSGVPPLNQEKQSRDGSATLGNPPQNTSSPEGAKEGGEQLPKLLDELNEVVAA